MQETPENLESDVHNGNLSQQSTKTPDESRSKIKRTLSNVESPSPRFHSGRSAHVKDRERDLFDFHEGSDGEVEVISKVRDLRGRVQQPKKFDGKSDLEASEKSPVFAESAAQNYSKTITPAENPASHLACVSNNVVEQGNLRPSILASTVAQQEPSSSSSFISPSKTIVIKIASPNHAQLQYDDMEDELSHGTDNHSVANNPIVLLPQPLKVGKDISKGLGNLGEDEVEIRTNRSRKRKTAPQSTPDELGSDDSATEIPQEHYVKRSTRSRSERGQEELLVPVNFSKKPENVAKVAVTSKRKLKRSKTTAFQELRPSSYDEEDEEDPLSDRKGRQENSTDHDKDRPHSPPLDIETKVTEHNESAGDELKAKKAVEVPKPSKKRGRPKKEKGTEENRSSLKALEELREGDQSRMGTTNEQKRRDEDDAQRDTGHHMILDNEGDDNEETAVEGDPTKISAAVDERVLVQTTGNSAPAAKTEGPTKSISGPRENEHEPETPKKAGKAPGKGLDQHSPISNGKVSYRVGLSKRARIEPLLRIVRK